MAKVIHSFSERLSNPHLELINFEYVLSNKYLATIQITEAYLTNSNSFATNLRQELRVNYTFKRKFMKHFPKLYAEIEKDIENNLWFKKDKKNHLRK